MDQREFRPLQAAAEREGHPLKDYPHQKRQKTITKVACNACRSKKSAVSASLITQDRGQVPEMEPCDPLTFALV